MVTMAIPFCEFVMEYSTSLSGFGSKIVGIIYDQIAKTAEKNLSINKNTVLTSKNLTKLEALMIYLSSVSLSF